MRVNVIQASLVPLILAACTAPGAAPSPEVGRDNAALDESAATWQRCAGEWEVCRGSGTRRVRYGTEAAFVVQAKTGDIDCTNDTFGDDPAYGTSKTCWNEVPSATTWTRCASEWERCSFSGTRRVRYGTETQHVIVSFTGGAACTNDAFGTDPAYGTTKACWYENTTTVPPVTDGVQAMAIGQHFHELPGAHENGPIVHAYDFARTHNHEDPATGQLVGLNDWWVGHDQYDFPILDRFVNFHVANGARILLDFYGMPRFASARPDEVRPQYPGRPGVAAEPADLGSYGRMVKATVARYPGKIIAVECSNEPYANSTSEPEFFSGSPTALADMCKEIYVNTKAVDATIPVVCPAQAYLGTIPQVLAARTSSGEPIHRFCDYIGAHPYGATATPGVGSSLADEVALIKSYVAGAGIDKPIAITEWGVYYRPGVYRYAQMTSAGRGQVLYDTLVQASRLGVKLFGLYSYDSRPDPTIPIDFSTAYGASPWGYIAMVKSVDSSGVFHYDQELGSFITKAVQDIP